MKESDLNFLPVVVGELLKDHGTANIITSFEQAYLLKKVQMTQKHSPQDEESASKIRTSRVPEDMFRVDQKPHVLLRAPGHYMNVHKNQPNNMYDCMVVFSKCDQDGQTPIYFEDVQGYTPTEYAGNTNVISGITRLEPGEAIRVKSDTVPNTMENLRNEQKRLTLITEIVARRSEGGQRVVDLFSGTGTTAVACMTLPEQRYFIGCDIDERAVSYSKECMLIDFAKLILLKKMTLPNTEYLQEEKYISAALLFYSHKRDSLSATSDKNWSAPPHLPQYTIVQKSTRRFLSALYGDAGFLKVQALHIDRWPSRLQGLIHQCQVPILRGEESSRCSLLIRDGVVYADKTFGRNSVFSTIVGTFVYHDMSNRQQKTKKYGEGIFGVTPTDFRNNKIPLKVQGECFRVEPGKGDKFDTIYLVPAAFSLFRNMTKSTDENAINVCLDIANPYTSVIGLVAGVSISATKDIGLGEQVVLDARMLM